MNEFDRATAITHRMIGGSHERPTGPECRCGAEWDYWGDTCTAETRSRVDSRA